MYVGYSRCYIAKADSVQLWRCIIVACIKVEEYTIGACTIEIKRSPLYDILV